MGFFSKLFGRSTETDDQREEREYYEQVNKNDSISFAPPPIADYSACLVVEDVFTVMGRGTVVVGSVKQGSFSVGDNVYIETSNGRISSVITGIEQFRKLLDTVSEGEDAGILLSNVTREQVKRNDMIIK